MTDIEAGATRKIFWHVMPLLLLGSAMSYVDRSNISFAALTMNQDLGLSAASFGLASGAFYLTYAVFELPSNAILAKVGARRWLARIMITWGLMSAATAFATGFKSLVALRLLLGAAEAGFTPGVFWLMTLWFPERYRGRMVGLFLAIQVLGIVFGAAMSGPLLQLDAGGLKGWQWMFIVQGLPTVALGLVLLRVLVDRPADAKWLTAEEKSWLADTLAAEHSAVRARGATHATWRAMLHPRVLLLTLVYFLVLGSGIAFNFFAPQILRETGLSLTMTGLCSALAYTLAGIAVIFWGWWVDRSARRERVAATACLVLAVGFGAVPIAHGTLTLVLLLCLMAIGTRAAVSAFWSLPPGFVHPAALGLVIGSISSIGNLGGVVGPYMFGVIRDSTGDYGVGALVTAAMAFAAAVLILVSPMVGRSKA